MSLPPAMLMLIVAVWLLASNRFFSVDVTVGSFSLPYVTLCHNLGILVPSSLSHSSHIADNINTASQRSDLILLSFVRKSWKLHSLCVIPLLELVEYNSFVWSPQYIYDIHALEKLREGLPNLRLPPLQGLSYSSRIEKPALLLLFFESGQNQVFFVIVETHVCWFLWSVLPRLWKVKFM